MKSLLATEFQLCGGSDAGTGYEGAEVAAMPTAPRISSIMTGVINEENGEPCIDILVDLFSGFRALNFKWKRVRAHAAGLYLVKNL